MTTKPARLAGSLAAPLAGLLGLMLVGVAPAAAAGPLTLSVRPQATPLFAQHPWHRLGNPNVTPSNPMGVVGWDGPPDDVPGVSAEAGPMAPGSIANAPFEGYGFY